MSAHATFPQFVGGPTGPGRAAPGPGGYVIAVLVADLLTAVTIALALAGSALEVLQVVVFAGIFTVVLSVPVAMVCVPVVHLLSRRHPRQWWHVVVTGLVTLGAVVTAGLAVGDLRESVVLLPVVVATCLGRAALVPAVRRARVAVTAPAGHGPVPSRRR